MAVTIDRVAVRLLANRLESRFGTLSDFEKREIVAGIRNTDEATAAGLVEHWHL